jgi:hypothetical protein
MCTLLPRTLINLPLWVLLAAVVLIPEKSSRADEMPVRHRTVVHHHHHIRLPPERHVIEGERPPGSGVFLINGRIFTAASNACWPWTAGDRIVLLSGDWHGYCDVAVFRNLRRHSTCTMWC